MKEIQLTFFLLCIAVSTMAQWSTSSTNIYNTNSGNVGIGISSPSEKLDVSGNINISGAYKTKNSNNYSIMLFAHGSDNYSAVRSVSPNSMRNTLRFQQSTHGNTIIHEVARFNEDGDFNVLNSYLLNGNNINTAGTLSNVAYLNQANSYIGGSAAIKLQNESWLNFYNDVNSSRISISHNSATNKLDIYDRTAGDWARIHTGEYIIGNGDSKISEDASGNMTFTDTNVGTKTLAQLVNGGLWENNTGHIVYASGNVAVGNSTTSRNLHVYGNIYSKEVKVQYDLPAPDYVFEKDYELMELDKLEKYLKDNKHLPEIPSAKEIKENGIELAEMNMLLLKKVEELTLYILQQEKRIEKLENKN